MVCISHASINPRITLENENGNKIFQSINIRNFSCAENNFCNRLSMRYIPNKLRAGNASICMRSLYIQSIQRLMSFIANKTYSINGKYWTLIVSNNKTKSIRSIRCFIQWWLVSQKQIISQFSLKLHDSETKL